MTASEYVRYRRELTNFKLAKSDDENPTKPGEGRVGHISLSPRAQPSTPAFLQRFLKYIPEVIASLSYSIVTRIIGNGLAVGQVVEFTTNPLTTASIPYAGAVDSAGNIYWVDRGSGFTAAVRRLNASTNTIENLFEPGASVSGITLNLPRGFTRDSAGNMAITDSVNNRLLYYSVVPTTTLYGVSCTQNAWTQIVSAASTPQQLSFAPNGDIYWADFGSSSVKKISKSGGTVTNILTSLSHSRTVFVDSVGNIFIVGGAGFVFMLPVVAGTYFGRYIPAAPAGVITSDGESPYRLLPSPTSIIYGAVTDSLGNLYVNGQTANTINRIDFKTGALTVFAGSGVVGYQDGPLATSKFGNTLVGLFMDSNDNLYVCDGGSGVSTFSIRKIPCDQRIRASSGRYE